MSHSVVRGAIFIPPPTPGGGLSYYILLTRQFGISRIRHKHNTIQAQYNTRDTRDTRDTKDYIFIDTTQDSRVTPNTPHLSLEENKRLYLCCFASCIICFTKLLQL